MHGRFQEQDEMMVRAAVPIRRAGTGRWCPEPQEEEEFRLAYVVVLLTRDSVGIVDFLFSNKRCVLISKKDLNSAWLLPNNPKITSSVAVRTRST